MGAARYRKHQEKHINIPLEKGVAFPFVRRFLDINKKFPVENPVEVVLLSRNSASTGKRVFRSIQYYGLSITRAAFIEGRSPYPYIPAFNASLFLSANEDDVRGALNAGFPAGVVLPGVVNDDEQDSELRIAFDFDGVIADDESEQVYKGNGGIDAFHKHESEKVSIPMNPGPLADLFKKISLMQKMEDKAVKADPNYKRILRTAIITARNAPSHERAINSIKKLDANVNEVFFLGGMEKSRILSIFKPHVFFDDQRDHLKSVSGDIPMVHIPFGIANAK